MNGRMEQLEKTFEKVCDYVEKINARLTRLEERNGTNKTTAAYNALFAELGSRLFVPWHICAKTSITHTLFMGWVRWK